MSEFELNYIIGRLEKDVSYLEKELKRLEEKMWNLSRSPIPKVELLEKRLNKLEKQNEKHKR